MKNLKVKVSTIIIACAIIFGIAAMGIGISSYANRPQLTEYYVEDSKGANAEIGVIKYTPKEKTYEVYLPNTGEWYPATTEKLAKVSIQVSLASLTGGTTNGLVIKSHRIGSEKDAMSNEGLFFVTNGGKVYIEEKGGN